MKHPTCPTLPHPARLHLTTAALTFACGILCVAATSRAAAETLLADQGASPYRIVVATNSLPSERYAAEELQRYLEKITGAKLTIVTGGPSTGAEIRLGRAAADLAPPPKNPDAFTLRTSGARLLISGAEPRGTLYGVYALLEEKLGVRWFTPDCEVAPRTSRLPLPKLDETQTPPLEYREVYWSEMLHNADFCARHRLNGATYGLTEKHGGRGAVYFPFVHSLDALVPPEVCKEHPEYLPLIDGKRKSGYVQRCLANPDVIKMSIARVRQWIKEHPGANIISVSQNDTFNYCKCDACQALDEAEGSPSASLIRFVNLIAADLEHDFPAVRIDTLAYQYTRRPPKTLRPRPNVIVRLCSIECCFAHDLGTCPSEENHRFRDDILAWQPVAPLLYVWDYTPNFGHYQQPFPNFDSLQPNARFFAGHGVKGLFEQGNYSGGGAGEMEPLRAYLLAKILWNPDTDVKRHTTEFLDAYYGTAAGDIRAYLDLLEAQVRDGKAHAHIFDSPKAAYLNDGFVAKALEIFDHAEAAPLPEPFRARVHTARLPIWYVQIATGRVRGADRSRVFDLFVEGARRAGVTDVSEGRTLNDWAEKEKGK